MTSFFNLEYRDDFAMQLYESEFHAEEVHTNNIRNIMLAILSVYKYA